MTHYPDLTIGVTEEITGVQYVARVNPFMRSQFIHYKCHPFSEGRLMVTFFMLSH